MKAFSIGRKVVAGAASAAVATSVQPSAHAREVVAQAPTRDFHPRTAPIDDRDWLLTDLDQEVLIFKPYKPSDVDTAVEQVHAMMSVGPSRPSTHSVVIEEEEDGGFAPTPSSDTDSLVTNGTDADVVLSQPTNNGPFIINTARPGGNTPTGALGADSMPDLLKIAAKLLKRPGLQAEVFKVMIEDSEVRDLMLKQSRNLDAYLEAVGVHNPRLLEGGAQASPMAFNLNAGSDTSEGEEGGNHVLHGILKAVAACIDKTGNFFAGLGSWLMDRFGDLGQHMTRMLGMSAEEEEDTHDEKEGSSSGKRCRSTTDTVLGAVMVVAVGVFCVMLARNPGVVVAAATAAAAHQQANASQRRNTGLA